MSHFKPKAEDIRRKTARIGGTLPSSPKSKSATRIKEEFDRVASEAEKKESNSVDYIEGLDTCCHALAYLFFYL